MLPTQMLLLMALCDAGIQLRCLVKLNEVGSNVLDRGSLGSIVTFLKNF